jgi:hypothetical protein
MLTVCGFDGPEVIWRLGSGRQDIQRQRGQYEAERGATQNASYASALNDDQ